MQMRSSMAAPGRGGNGLRASMLVALAATMVLAAYGLVRYPAVRSDPGSWVAGMVFLLLTLGYGAAALALSPGTTARAISPRMPSATTSVRPSACF
jgi:hypothetical protein